VPTGDSRHGPVGQWPRRLGIGRDGARVLHLRVRRRDHLGLRWPTTKALRPGSRRSRARRLARTSMGHAGFTSKVMPVSRSETSQSLAIASRSRARPNIGRRTSGPQFTHRGCRGHPRQRPDPSPRGAARGHPRLGSSRPAERRRGRSVGSGHPPSPAHCAPVLTLARTLGLRVHVDVGPKTG
jgi:hypothetical protein